MRSHVFGATSSPCAMYAFWKVASDNEANKDVDAVATMGSNIYVNDLWKSYPTKQKSVKLVIQFRQLLVSGGFRFFSNQKNILINVRRKDLTGRVEISSWGLPI